MIYIIMFIVMIIFAWISYEMYNAPFDDKNK